MTDGRSRTCSRRSRPLRTASTARTFTMPVPAPRAMTTCAYSSALLTTFGFSARLMPVANHRSVRRVPSLGQFRAMVRVGCSPSQATVSVHSGPLSTVTASRITLDSAVPSHDLTL
ncbi:hypothetical protein ACFQ2M_13985 [Kitasatospora saccharophila]|uniref:hypothetical protein n=1 Tax=Kitasatospora saccharophila TaxID=407973 RepID=UPI003643367B